MKKISILLLILSCITTFGQAKDIRGLVKNSTGENIEYVTVQVSGNKNIVRTDSLGVFVIKNINPGNYKLSFSLQSYKTRTIDVTVGANTDVTELPAMILDESVYHLGEVVISAQSHKYTTQRISESIRLNEPLIQIPQNIQVISTDIMHDQQIISMSDGLTRNVSGLTRLEHWGDSYVRINMRGSRAAAFREGMNVTSNWGPLTEDVSFVERIEFVKGPAGFMMSNGEPSGIYNVVMKKPTGQKKGQASFLFGSNDLYRGTLDLDGIVSKDSKLLYRLNVMGQSANSIRQYEFNKRYSVAPVVTYDIDDKTKLTAQYTFQYMQSSNTGSFYSFSPNGYADLPFDYTMLEPGLEPTVIQDHSLIFNLQHELSENWKLTAQAAYFNYNKEGSSMWYETVEANGNMIRSVSIGDAINEMKFGQVFVNGEVKTGAVNHRILGGLDMGDKHFWGDWSQRHLLDLPGTYNVYDGNRKQGVPSNGYPQFDRARSMKERANTTQISQSYAGLYVQDELGFFDEKLRLTLAGRYTYVKDNSYGTTVTDQKHFSPRIGLSYSITENLSAYALFDQTFSPQMGILRNGDKVKPITGNNMELGLKRSWFDGRWNTSLSVYQILKDNETTADPDNQADESYLIQVGQSKAKGVEFDMMGEIVKGLSLVANYAYTDYKVTKSINEARPVGMRLPGHAKHVFNIWLKYQFSESILKGFSLGAGQTSMLDRSTWGGLVDGKSGLPDYYKFDAVLGWSNENLMIGLNVFNLFDRYLYSGSKSSGVYYWQSEPNRNFRLGVTYKF